MSLLEQDNIRKRLVNKRLSIELDKSNSKKYEVKLFGNNKVYTKKSYSGQLLSFISIVS